MSGRDGFAEEKPTEDKIEDRRKLDKNTEIGGIIELKNFIVGDAGEAINNASDDKDHDSGDEPDGEIDARKRNENECKNNKGDAVKIFLRNRMAAFEVIVGKIIIKKNTE